MKRIFILSLIAVAFSLSTFGLNPKPVVQDNSFKTLEFTVNGVSFKMVAVEGGTFQMGATSEQQDPHSYEKPVHSVTLSNYYIGETEVTQALWEAVMGTTIRDQAKKGTWSTDLKGIGYNYPMYYISYDDCVAFVKKLNEKLKAAGQLPAGREFRLPTEAEWEFAARGGNRSRGYRYSGSNTLSSVAWYNGNSNNTTHPVKQKQANELGLYDMSGNVWEWCYDWYGDYPSLSQTNPKGPSTGSDRVLRGGSWNGCRVASRNDSSPGSRVNDLGLRLALSLSTFGQNPKPVVQDNSFKTLEFTVGNVHFKMVAVEGGTFQMGATSEQQNPDSDEKPVHSVTLSNYYIGETEVTQALWEAVMGSNPSYFKGSDKPVECVSYEDCVTFVNKLNSLLSAQLPGGRKFRLPTEAEWEFAARGGNRSQGYRYSGSNTLSSVAWYGEFRDIGSTHPVKQKQANELGLYDMSGNVWEWCYDWYGDYSSSSQTNPKGPSTGSYRVLRGGSWDYDAQGCRVARRLNSSPDYRFDFSGLRLAL